MRTQCQPARPMYLQELEGLPGVCLEGYLHFTCADKLHARPGLCSGAHAGTGDCSAPRAARSINCPDGWMTPQTSTEYVEGSSESCSHNIKKGSSPAPLVLRGCGNLHLSLQKGVSIFYEKSVLPQDFGEYQHNLV